ncbi:MAG: tyrosine-protein phosphatase [Pseudomonadaceae bacterium]|nr:tyrosine-protein phosphatase [Pseudomonadaceae bacterium]
MSDRLVQIDGALNFRDFGGYHGADNRQIRTGVLFRCGNLASISPAGAEQFSQLGIARLCDLRRHDELLEDPSAIAEDRPERIHIPMDPASAAMLGASLTSERQTAGVQARVDFMCAINRELVATHVDDYRLYVQALLNTEDGGFLVHCTAGKDRTGVAVAIVQLALGVSEETIMEDYLLTNEVLDFEGYMYQRLVNNYGITDIDPEEVRALSGVRPEYLSTALDTMRTQFGSTDGYLREIGLDESARARLQQRYLM